MKLEGGTKVKKARSGLGKKGSRDNAKKIEKNVKEWFIVLTYHHL